MASLFQTVASFVSPSSNMSTPHPIVVVESGKSPAEGQIVDLSTASDLSALRGLVGAKLGLLDPSAFFVVNGETDSEVTDLEQAKTARWLTVKFRENELPKEPLGPKPLPLLGNTLELAGTDPRAKMREWFDTYGPVIRVHYPGRSVLWTNDADVIEVVGEEGESFGKRVTLGKGALGYVRFLTGDGLFTTSTPERAWELGHKILMPAFSPRAIRAYHSEMEQIAIRAADLFEIFVESKMPCDIGRYCNEVTLQTIGQIGFNYNLGVLEPKDIHSETPEFARRFWRALTHAKALGTRPGITGWVEWVKGDATQKEFDDDIVFLKGVVNDVVQARKQDPDAKDRKDLLQFMLDGADEKGDQLSASIVADEIITFLVAGHETTGASLAWFLLALSQHPDVEARVIQELVDVGLNSESTEVTDAQIKKLVYTDAVLHEVFRLYSAIQAVAKDCLRDCVIPGNYKVSKGETMAISIDNLHVNSKFWPEPDSFKPERWLPENRSKIHPEAWQTFSKGARGCIGRQFALQELRIIIPLWLIKFKFTPITKDVTYESKGITLRPADFRAKVQKRGDLPTSNAETTVAEGDTATEPSKEVFSVTGSSTQTLPPVLVAFGSNSGTCEDFAHEIKTTLHNLGFVKIDCITLDELTIRIDSLKPVDGVRPLLIAISATYNGYPPDNAKKFSSFLDEQQPNTRLFDGVDFAVFGAGNSQWGRTFQAFPTKIETQLANIGAKLIFERGQTDANEDIEIGWRQWVSTFQVSLVEKYGIQVDSDSAQSMLFGPSASAPPKVEVRHVSPDEPDFETAQKAGDQDNAKILVSQELQDVEKSHRSTRHIEIQLPPGETYDVADHLEVWPENDPEMAKAVALRTGLVPEAVISLTYSSDVAPRSLAASVTGPVTIKTLLEKYCDLLAPPSRAFLALFATELKSTHPDAAEELMQGASPDDENARAGFLAKYRRVYDVLMEFPTPKIPLGNTLASLTSMQPRRYSISSSPLVHPDTATVCIGVVDVDNKDGKRYPGLSSGFLSRLSPTNTLRIGIKSASETFSPPSDPKIPIIMICAGTGISPFIGFLEHRQKLGFKSVANGGESKTVLFFGCRGPYDEIYKDRTAAWLEDGTLDQLHVAHSRFSVAEKYVNHLILSQAWNLWKLVNEGARFYICGSAGSMARDVKTTLTIAAIQMGVGSKERAEDWMSHMVESGRYVEDVWG